jgi:hypothetical protein
MDAYYINTIMTEVCMKMPDDPKQRLKPVAETNLNHMLV